MARNGDVMRSDRLKQVMQQIDPNFDERNAGFNRFSKFVLEAGQRGVVTVTKLDNGQFEVSPGTVAAVPPLAPAPRGRDGEAREGREPRDGREDGGRGRRGRRGGRGRGDRQAEPGREPSTREVAASRPRPTDGALSLARAFQLMAQALSELRGPVNQEALRLRMAALHGREDTLLDPARFPRLLRQANDAEIADVRKVGDDDYEISDRRGGGAAPAPSAPAASTPAAGSVLEPGEGTATGEHVAEVSPAVRENGQRFGVRFRRGSRGGMRAGDIPLIGVVQVDSPPAEPLPVEVAAVETAEPADETERKPARPRRAARKPAPSRSEGKTAPSRSEGKAATATATKAGKPAKAPPPGEEPGAAPATPVKRGRSRARKKAE
jgi:hypothetical protein